MKTVIVRTRNGAVVGAYLEWDLGLKDTEFVYDGWKEYLFINGFCGGVGRRALFTNPQDSRDTVRLTEVVVSDRAVPQPSE